MQSLRALLLLVVISTTLFHLASTGDALAPVNAEIAKGNNATGKMIAGGGQALNDANEEREKKEKEAKETFEDGRKKACADPTTARFNPLCSASAISNLLSLAVVIVVGLFSRQ